MTLSEQLNGAHYRIAQAEAAIAEAQSRTDAAIAQRQKIRRLLGQRAAQIYRHAGSSTPLQQMDVSSLGEMAARSKYASAAADRDDQLIARLQKAEEELAARKADLETKRAAAKAEADAADLARIKLDSTNRQSRALLGQVNGQIADIIRRGARPQRDAAIRRNAAAAAQRASTNNGGGSGHSPIPANFPDAPAPNAGAAAAVAFAKAQVGKGYRYATFGPGHLRLLRSHRRRVGPGRRRPGPLLRRAVPGRRSASAPAISSPVTSCSTDRAARSTSRSTSAAEWSSPHRTRRAA